MNGLAALLAGALLAIGLSVAAGGQAGPGEKATEPQRAAAPLFRISFQRGEAVQGLSASPVIIPPFQCTSDGTVFISMLRPPDFQGQILTSVSTSREARAFELSQVPELFDLSEVSHYASDSGVVFLVRAAHKNDQTKQGFVTSDGTRGEFPRNATEHSFFIVTFDRAGKYTKTVQVENSFRILRLGAFPSGLLLAYGYAEEDSSPRLALLKDDGTLLKFIQVPDGVAPQAALAKDAKAKSAARFIAPVQMVGRGGLIYLVQNKTSFPILEVSEAGAARPIGPQLPAGVQINMLVSSDDDLYARVGETSEGSIYELSSEDGTVIKRFEVVNDESGADIACIHDGKFLSFEHGSGTLIPLVGTPEPVGAKAVVGPQKSKAIGPSN